MTATNLTRADERFFGSCICGARGSRATGEVLRTATVREWPRSTAVQRSMQAAP